MPYTTEDVRNLDDEMLAAEIEDVELELSEPAPQLAELRLKLGREKLQKSAPCTTSNLRLRNWRSGGRSLLRRSKRSRPNGTGVSKQIDHGAAANPRPRTGASARARH